MAEARESCCVGVVGLGLIGGSLALALRRSGAAHTLLAWDARDEALQEGLALGVIDARAESLEALMDAVDVAFLAAPTVASEGLLRRMLQSPGRARVITDVASVKGTLCAAVEALSDAEAARFVPGHPIAGSERSGVAAAHADLFRAHRVILTPTARTEPAAVAEVRALWEAAGAEVSLLAVAEHDAVLAATSHLPHMLAYALVDALTQAPLREDIFRFAAGGFRDFTRIAASDPVMWRDVALANRGALLEALDGFEAHLAGLRAAIEEGDGAMLEKIFRSAKTARDEYGRAAAARLTPSGAAAPADPL